MRYLGLLVLILSVFAATASARCTCVEDAATDSGCSSADDFSCLCGTAYKLTLRTCFALSFEDDCTTSRLNRALRDFNDGCNSSGSSGNIFDDLFGTPSESTTEDSEPTPTPSETESATESEDVTSTAEPSLSTAESTVTLAPTASATDAVVVGGAAGDTSSSDSSDQPASKPKLSKGAIGGIAGAGIGVVAVGIAVGAFFLARRYKKKDAIKAETNTKEVESFIQEGRRKPSAAVSAYSPSSGAPSGTYGDRSPLEGSSALGAGTVGMRSVNTGYPHNPQDYEQQLSPPVPPPPPQHQQSQQNQQPQPQPQNHNHWYNFHRNAEGRPEVQPLSPGSYNQHQQIQEIHSPNMTFHPQGYY